MNQGSADIRRRNHRLRVAAVIVQLGVFVGVAGWVAWIAVTRWDGQPALEQVAGSNGFPPGRPISAELDRTEELVDALAAIPPLPVFNPPPPPDGMRWVSPSGRTVSASDVLRGAWAREDRPHLRAVVEYILSPAVETALQAISDIPPTQWNLGEPMGVGFSGTYAVRLVTRIRVARARYQCAERGDVEAALAEFEAAYRLTDFVYDSGTQIGLMTALTCNSLADSELIHLSRENRLSRTEAALAIATVRGAPFAFRDLWQMAVDANWGDLTWILDTTYTDDGNGDGWLVLSHLQSASIHSWAAERRCGAWNILSPAFNSRKIVAGKIDRLRAEYEAALTLPFEQARTLLATCEARSFFGIADGPLAVQSASPVMGNLLRNVTHHVAGRRATLIAIALSAYRTERGHYPHSLDELVPIYLEELPLDPFGDRPFHYTLKKDEDYGLYSVGLNLVDDGGVNKWSAGQSETSEADDVVFAYPRGESKFEPVLERIQP